MEMSKQAKVKYTEDGLKICNVCKVPKPPTTENFYKAKTCKDGLAGTCIPCGRAKRQKYWNENKAERNAYMAQRYIDNKEEILERNKKWREANPEKKKAVDKRYRLRHPDRVNARSRAWREANLARQEELTKVWREANPDRAKAIATNARHRRRVHLKHAVKDLTPTQWLETIKYFADECAYCGSKLELTQDHVVPVSDGGDHTMGNVIPACISCNSYKHARPMEIWFRGFEHFTEERLRKILAFVEANKKTL